LNISKHIRNKTAILSVKKKQKRKNGFGKIIDTNENRKLEFRTKARKQKIKINQ